MPEKTLSPSLGLRMPSSPAFTSPPGHPKCRRIRLIEGNAKSLREKSNMEKDFSAVVYLSEALSPPRFLSLGGRAILSVGSESGHIQNVKVLQYLESILPASVA
jgi:hypothetical protein